MNEELRLLTIKEVQALLGGKSRQTIYRWIEKGIFPAPTKVGGSSLWPEEQLREWRKQLTNNEA